MRTSRGRRGPESPSAGHAPCLASQSKANESGGEMGILKALGIAVIVLWLVLWLAVKITFGAIHLLLVLGLVMLVVGFAKAQA